MSLTETFKEFYKICKEMDIEDTVEVALSAESQEEYEFIELICNFILQQRQKEVVAKNKF